MPANKYALLRYRIIDRTLRNRQRSYPSKDDLRAACEEALYGSDGEHISMSTIDKDLWAMRNEGELGYYAPIKFSKDRGGYYYEDPDYTISELPLTDDDLDAIQSAAQTLFQFKDVPLFREFDAAIEKILDRMKISAADDHKSEHDVLQFERGVSNRGSAYLAELFKAAKDDRQVKLFYQKFGSDQVQEVPLNPYLLKEYGGRWYVIGWVRDKEEMRTYSLDRIQALESTEVPFVRNQDFDTGAFFRYAMGITVTDEKPAEIRLTFSDRLAPYIMSQPMHHSQEVVRTFPDGRVEICLNVLLTVELVTAVLGYGDGVKVESPPQLKEAVISSLTKCLKNYSEGT